MATTTELNEARYWWSPAIVPESSAVCEAEAAHSVGFPGCVADRPTPTPKPRVVEVQLTPEEEKAWDWGGIRLGGYRRGFVYAGLQRLYDLDSGKRLEAPRVPICAIDVDRGICQELIRTRDGSFLHDGNKLAHRFTRRNLRIEFNNTIDGLPNPLIVRGIDMGETNAKCAVKWVFNAAGIARTVKELSEAYTITASLGDLLDPEPILLSEQEPPDPTDTVKRDGLKCLSAVSDRIIAASQRKQTNANLRGVFG